MSEPSPPLPEAVIQTAARLLATGRAAEAAERLHQLVDEAPTYAAAHVLLASALDASGRPSEALEIWRRAAFLVPQSPLVHRERQRLIDAHRAAPVEMTPEPEEVLIDPWHETTPDPIDTAPEDAGQALEDDRGTEAAPLPTEMATDALSDPASATQTAEPDETQLENQPIVEEPIEMPLLPPEGDASSMPRPSPAEVELEDDGWAIIEDDRVPPAAEMPIATPLLPPEPEADSTPPVARPAPEPDLSPEPEPATPDSSIADDLDDLITQLDTAPRIKPDPTFSGPKVTFDESSMDDMVSETLAKIYAAQHQYVEAAVVYEKLAAREPENADALLERAAEMREKAS